MIAITGGTGLVGKALAQRLKQQEQSFRIGSRTAPEEAEILPYWQKIDLADGYGLGNFLAESRQIVHLARNNKPLTDIGGTWRLAYRAEQHNIRHLIFLHPNPSSTYTSEAVKLLQTSGLQITIMHTQPSFEWLERYFTNRSKWPLHRLSSGTTLAPLSISRIASHLGELIMQDVCEKSIKLTGEETMTFQTAANLFRKYKSQLQTPREISANTWEEYLIQRAKTD